MLNARGVFRADGHLRFLDPKHTITFKNIVLASILALRNIATVRVACKKCAFGTGPNLQLVPHIGFAGGFGHN